MKDKTNVELAKLEITAEQMSRLTEDEIGFMIALDIAINTINFYQFVTVPISKGRRTGGIGAEYSDVRVMTCYRLLGSVALELSKTIVGFRNRLQGKGQKIDLVWNEADYIENDLRNNKYYDVLAAFRNMSTNHYDAKELGKLTQAFGPDHVFSSYLHRQQGNSISMMGEEVAYLGPINVSSLDMNDIHAIEDLIGTLAGRFIKFREQFFIRHLKYKIGDLVLKGLDVEVDSDLVGDLEKFAMPVFLLR